MPADFVTSTKNGMPGVGTTARPARDESGGGTTARVSQFSAARNTMPAASSPKTASVILRITSTSIAGQAAVFRGLRQLAVSLEMLGQNPVRRSAVGGSDQHIF